MKFYKKSTRLAPRTVDHHLSLGMAYFKLKKYGLARSAWTKVLEIAPGNAKAKKYIKIVEKKLAK